MMKGIEGLFVAEMGVFTSRSKSGDYTSRRFAAATRPYQSPESFYCALLVTEVHIGKAISLGVAIRPLEVIHQAPRVIRAHSGSVSDGAR